jgi:hypothetical protein
MIVCALAVVSAEAVACSSSSNGGACPCGSVDGGKQDATSDSMTADTSVADTGAPADTAAPVDGSSSDSASDAGAGDGEAPKLLVTYGVTASDLYVVDVAGKFVAGSLPFPGAFGAPFTQAAAPYLLEQAADIVAQLDPVKPWTVDSSWNVAVGDAIDGGAAYSDPYQIVVVGPSGYVIRYTRNKIAVVDVSTSADAGLPESVIDLSSLVQPNDSDHVIEMTAGVYVASSKLLYVVLANIDRNLVSPSGTNLFCSSTVSSVIAIDTTTNMIKSLGGTAPGGGIALTGFDPITGGVAYDAAGGRLLIAEAGCNMQGPGDGGMGALVKRGVEAVNLATGQTSILHDGSQDGVPSVFVYIDPTHAVLGFDYTGSETVAWDPTKPALGAAIPNAPDLFVYDGVANLLGVLTTFGADGGSTTDIISAPLAGGAATTLVSNPFPMSAGCGSYCVGGLDLWPHP